MGLLATILPDRHEQQPSVTGVVGEVLAEMTDQLSVAEYNIARVMSEIDTGPLEISSTEHLVSTAVDNVSSPQVQETAQQSSRQYSPEEARVLRLVDNIHYKMPPQDYEHLRSDPLKEAA